MPFVARPVYVIASPLDGLNWPSRAAVAQIPLDASRHDKHDVSCKSWRDVTSCACCAVLVPTWGGGDEAVVLACKTISCFITIYYFSSQVKLIRCQKILAIITIHITNKLRCVSRLSRSSRRACRARGDVLCRACCNKWNLGFMPETTRTHDPTVVPKVVTVCGDAPLFAIRIRICTV